MEQKFEQNVTFSFICPLPAPLTPLPAIPFVLTKLKAVPLKHLKKLTKHQEILLLIFFISCFTVSVTPSINTYEFSSDFIISTISFISSFKRNKVKFSCSSYRSFCTYYCSFKFIYCISNLLITFEVILLTNPGKLSLAKGIAIFICVFSLNYQNKNQKIIYLIQLFR